MKKFFIIIWLCTVFISNAQNTMDRSGLTSSTPASVAYSLRKLSNSYTGPLVRIKVGTSFYDVYPDPSTYKFSLNSKISAPISTYNAAVSVAGSNALSSIITAGSTNATVVIWYDQSGNAIHVFSVHANGTASIITAGSINNINGQPTIKFSGTTSFLSSSNVVNYSAQAGATVNAIVQNSATSSAVGGIIGTCPGPSNQPGYNISYTAGKGYQSDCDGNGYGTSVITSDPKLITSIFINKTDNLSKIYVNRTLKTNTSVLTGVGTIYNTSNSRIHIGAARGYDGFNFDGNISETFIFPNQMSASEQTLLETNQNAFYFSPLVYISASDINNKSCPGASVTFTATTYNFIASPTYQWYINSIAISGATSSTYSTSSLSQNDVIQVICSSGSDGSNSSNSISWTLNTAPSLSISVTGDGCPNKSSLDATTGLSSYAWYKDNVLISGATTNTYSSPVAGDYKVTASNGTCTGTSAVRTISPCGVSASGKMISTASSAALVATLVSSEGGANYGTTIDDNGKIQNATVVTTSTGTIGASTASIGAVISAMNGIATSIGVVYSTDANFGTFTTNTIQSNVVAGTYTANLTGLATGTTYYAKSFVVNKAGTFYGSVVNFTTSSPKAVGDLYGGGIIYYILQQGDNGYDANVQHGLIAPFYSVHRFSTNPLPPIVESQIGKFAATISGATSDGTLLGKTNTDAIIANQGSTGTYAALYCRNYTNPTSGTFNSVAYTFQVYSDWYMPSIVEINKFKAYLVSTHYSKGSFSLIGNVRYYWGAAGNGNDYAWGKMLSSTMTGARYKLYYLEGGNEDGSTAYNGWGENDRLVVMPIRSF
jgi:hypothetical protein